MVGPGMPLDTERYFVICANVLGGCMGTTGPKAIDPATGKPWGLNFPVITIGDMVRAQAMLLDHLGIDKLFCVIGGSMGGMQVLQWAATIPIACSRRVPIACAARHSAQNIAFHEVGRQAIMADPDWCGGDYRPRQEPDRGSGGGAHGRAHHLSFGGGAASQVRPQPAEPQRASPTASTPISRSRAICATRARPSSTASTPIPISTSRARWTISTWRPSMAACSPTPSAARKRASAWSRSPATGCSRRAESRTIVHALNAVAANVSFVEIESDKGHDAFLLDEPEFRHPRRLPRGRRRAARPEAP